MNDLEKRSLYSFLGLYIVSSFFLISLVGYWYYVSQKRSMESEVHAKLEHVIDKEASRIISAQMQGETYRFLPPMEDIAVTLLDKHGKRISGTQLNRMSDHPFCMKMRMRHYGESNETLSQFPLGYYNENGYSVLISDAAKGHMGVARIIASTQMLSKSTFVLGQWVGWSVLLVMLAVAVIAWLLSMIFMHPVRERRMQIERFINDVTHELNTPITSLSMSTKQALNTGSCSQKCLNHIAISTRQLYDIYRSLTYLNFEESKEPLEVVEVETALRKSIDYYQPLAQIKRISLEAETKSCLYLIPSQQLSLLFGNLIGNAIKYSPAGSTVKITLKGCQCTIEDQGIGIAPSEQKSIFEKYKRGTTLSGGFGIGLSIVKSICDQYDISVSLESAPGAGTIFRLSFDKEQ